MSYETDYRKSVEQKRNGTDRGPMYPGRFICYMRDLMQTWFGNPDNIPEEKMKSVLFYPGTTPGAIGKSKVEINIAWPDNTITVDKTPSCTVYSTQAQSKQEGLYAINQNQFGGVGGRERLIALTYDLNLALRTTSYTLTQYLAETLFLYLAGYAHVLQQDANLSYFNPTGFTVSQLQDHEGNSKDIFDGTVTSVVTVSAPLITDTVGPVFSKFQIR